jgi:hypothetical protein
MGSGEEINANYQQRVGRGPVKGYKFAAGERWDKTGGRNSDWKNSSMGMRRNTARYRFAT